MLYLFYTHGYFPQIKMYEIKCNWCNNGYDTHTYIILNTTILFKDISEVLICIDFYWDLICRINIAMF